MEFRPLTAEYDAPLAALIRSSLEACGLDIPGTAYFDESLDRLSEVYSRPGHAYYVLTKDDGTFMGGIGLAEFRDGWCEMQKLYLKEEYRGRGYSYDMIRWIETAALRRGYTAVYLETHTKLKAAVHTYEALGYRRIRRPKATVHSAMNRFYLKELK